MKLIRITHKDQNNITYYLYYNASKEIAKKSAIDYIPKTNYIVDISEVNMETE
jgi:CRISPR/Cas system-associated exonuclease Cas4 (RecB family)